MTQEQELHRLLQRQLRKLPGPKGSEEAFHSLLQLVSDAYGQSDLDRKLLERSLELTSAELTDRNRKLKQQLDEQHKMREALQLSHSYLHASLNATHDGMLVIGLDHTVRLVNQVFLKLFNFEADPREQALESAIAQISERLLDASELIEAFERGMRDVHFKARMEVQSRDGHYIEVYSSQQLLGKEVVGHVWTFRDVTELRISEEEAKHRAYHDLLTGLPNRRLLMTRLAHALEAGQKKQTQTIVLFFDLDGFKEVNDYLGHGAGDAILKEVSKRIERELPEHTLLARHGGDEFVAVMEHQDNSDAATAFAESVIESFISPFLLAANELSLSCSIGIACAPEHGLEADKLISFADTAMYRAKSLGKNTYAVYSLEHDSQSIQRLKVRHQINTALEQNQFELFFQPKVSLKTGQIIGAEALIRWRDESGAYRNPLDFIPIAEENGQIIPISQWLMRECCLCMQRWKDCINDDFVLALNISARHFSNGALVNDLENALNATGGIASQLEFEVTETAVMEDVGLAIATLQALRERGVSIAVDDFGTGYSSLSYLRKLPIEVLKIDKSFVDDILHSNEDRTLVRGIIEMVHALGIEVVAEGIENQNMAQLLKEMNCDMVQGYYFCKPLPEHEFVTLMQSKVSYPLT